VCTSQRAAFSGYFGSLMPLQKLAHLLIRINFSNC
jgi:hypothetical protein